jgi:hypothetical protein
MLNTFIRDDALLSSRFRDPRRKLFYARAQLYEDRIEFFGISWKGVERRSIPLFDLARVDWRAGRERSANLILRLHSGEVIKIWMNGAGLWKYLIDANVHSLPLSLPEATVR